MLAGRYEFSRKIFLPKRIILIKSSLHRLLLLLLIKPLSLQSQKVYRLHSAIAAGKLPIVLQVDANFQLPEQ